MVLEDITQIIIGVVIKRKEAKYKSPNTRQYEIFNLKSYEEKISYDLLYSEEDLENFKAKKGDILLRLAFPLTIIEVDDEIEGKIINNQYCIIRMSSIVNRTYNIDFIKWFLESNKAKHQFEKMLIGTTIKSLPVSELRKLEIPNLDLEEQVQISKIVNTWNKQKKLYKKMLKQKEKYYDSVINKLINGGNK
jgi:restriction endonuclease S subunit